MTAPFTTESFSARQNAVLESALRLLVEGGEKALTTAGVARAANCSKESLYKWFGDRDGLLSAVITFQASKVRVRAGGPDVKDPTAFRALLVEFGEDLLRVLSGEVSIALNRLSIGQASREGSDLGGLLLRHGRRPIEIRLGGLLETGRAAGHLTFGDTAEAYRTLYGLIVRDMHVRLLLGDGASGEELDPRRRAETAVDQFLRLFGAGEK